MMMMMWCFVWGIFFFFFFFLWVVTSVLYWSLNNNRYFQLSMTFIISILANLNSAEVWMISSLPQIFSLPCFFSNLIHIVSRALNIIYMTFIFIILIFFHLCCCCYYYYYCIVLLFFSNQKLDGEQVKVSKKKPVKSKSLPFGVSQALSENISVMRKVNVLFFFLEN